MKKRRAVPTKKKVRSKKTTSKQRPVLLINFKCYEKGSAEHAVTLAKTCAKVAKEHSHIDILLAVQTADLYRVAQAVKLPLFAQHIDAIEPGPFTGHISPSTVKAAGASGTLLNHSEKRLSLEEIEDTIHAAQKSNLWTVVCAADSDVTRILASLHPTMLAIEPPELIGGEVSLATAHPELITDIVTIVRDIDPKVRVLVGAGIKNAADVKTALKLGAAGVLISSHIVQAKDPGSVLKELARACR